MRRTITLILALLLGFSIWGCRYVEFVSVGSQDLESGDIITVDGTRCELISSTPEIPGPERPQGTGLMWEWDSKGNQWKECICQMVAFRAVQAFVESMRIKNIHSGSYDITTGWNTDGPAEIMELTGWQGALTYADPITAGEYLTLDDAWYDFTFAGMTVRVRSTAGNYRFTHDTGHAGYHKDWNFFDYRTATQAGSGTTAEKNYFKNVVRPQIVNNFKGKTVYEVRLMAEAHAQ